MRDIHVDTIREKVAELCVEATHVLPEDVRQGLRQAQTTEQGPLAKQVLVELIENFDIAEHQMIPLCQDTGTTVVFVELGQDAHIVGGSLEEAIHAGVGQGYTGGYMRASIVEHPLTTRENTGNNTPAVIHYDIVPGDHLHLKILPKGGGCENMSRFVNLLPRAGKDAVINFVLRAIEESGGNPCPPLIVGVGIGGTSEYAMGLAKKAVTRGVGSTSDDPEIATLEAEMLDKINALGVGPQAVGGTNTALQVSILTYPTHITALPVAVNIQCHSARLKEVTL
ncbi:MAG TPA: fumarate hydratase [Dehalococcoidia bacterium]|jgi:fumarate hydratase subunit alpha|nr:fumarate hydratase [Dehalococcoidia bacterium]